LRLLRRERCGVVTAHARRVHQIADVARDEALAHRVAERMMQHRMQVMHCRRGERFSFYASFLALRGWP